MNKQKHLHHVIIKLAILTVLLFSAYLIGKQGRETMLLTNPQNNQVAEDTIQSLIARCGDIPESVGNKPNAFSNTNGTAWAPDCRHIAWSVSALAIDYPPQAIAPVPVTWEGVYLYTDATKKITRIHIPKHEDKEIKFVKWNDRNNMLLSINGQSRIIYNLLNNSVSPE